MSDPTVNILDMRSGQPVTIPSNILEVVGRANETLKAHLRPLNNIVLGGEWFDFHQTEDAAWQVSLRVLTADHSFVRQVRVDDIRSPAAAKDFVLDFCLDFCGSISAKVGEMIRQIRSDLKKMLAG